MTAVLAVPLGSTEQHGPHLPPSTDTDIAVALTRALAQERPNVEPAPAIPYGSSGEHAGFPNTLSIGQDALERVLVELVRSTDLPVLIVNAHGGNACPLARAVALLQREGRRVASWSPAYDGDLHAGFSETSLMLAIAPDAVDMRRAEKGDTRPWAEIGETIRRSGVAAVSPNGVLGDPTGASREAGVALFEELVASLVAAADAL